MTGMVAALLLGSTSQSEAREPRPNKKARSGLRAHLRSQNLAPAWRENYRVRVHGAPRISNESFLEKLDENLKSRDDFLVDLIDAQQALAWRQQFEDSNRDYKMREQAGILSREQAAGHTAAIEGFGNGVREAVEKREISKAERRAKGIIDKHQTFKNVMAPAVVMAGLYVGTPLRLRVVDGLQFRLRSNIREKFGAVEFDSFLLQGAFQFHPNAPERHQLSSTSVVNFENSMNMNYAVDHSQERYQFAFTRNLPWVDVTSRILLGLSSNTLVGSVSKRLTENITCVVDTIHWLTPLEATRGDEQNLRLRYDIRF